MKNAIIESLALFSTLRNAPPLTPALTSIWEIAVNRALRDARDWEIFDETIWMDVAERYITESPFHPAPSEIITLARAKAADNYRRANPIRVAAGDQPEIPSYADRASQFMEDFKAQNPDVYDRILKRLEGPE